jgi:hypothetical protein
MDAAGDRIAGVRGADQIVVAVDFPGADPVTRHHNFKGGGYGVIGHPFFLVILAVHGCQPKREGSGE